MFQKVSQCSPCFTLGFPYLEVSLGSECLPAHRALEGPVARVRAHVNLESRSGREILFADLTQVLVRANAAARGAAAVLVGQTCKIPSSPI